MPEDDLVKRIPIHQLRQEEGGKVGSAVAALKDPPCKLRQ